LGTAMSILADDMSSGFSIPLSDKSSVSNAILLLRRLRISRLISMKGMSDEPAPRQLFR
jgi:hypothetical protein